VSAVAAGLLIAGCGDTRLPEYELTGPVMGTSFSVKLVDPPAGTDLDVLGAAIKERLEDIEDRFSTWRPASELSKVNAALTTDWIPVSAEFCSMLAEAIDLSRQTNGAFDVTVGPLVLLWGFGPEAMRSAPPGDELVAEARNSVGFEKLDTDCSVPAIRKALPGVSIDFSAFAKGFAVDKTAELLDDNAIGNYLVEIGGELCATGHNADSKAWAIAIEKPDPASRSVQSVVRVTGHCMATSGDYRNFFEHDGIRYSHTIDPATGQPVRHDTASVTVIADSAANADGIATALLVMGADNGMAYADSANLAAYFLVRTDAGFEVRANENFEEMLN
jgi:thiamine biosynthesis lipoprotein